MHRLHGERGQGEGDHAYFGEGEGLRRGRGHQAAELCVRPAFLEREREREREKWAGAQGVATPRDSP